jgi:hypothetical protein
MPMRVDKQIAVFLENRPGTLAGLCEALARKDINLLALTVADTVDHSVVRMVVDKPEAAVRVVRATGALHVESDVLVVEAANRTGALAAIAERLATQDINIEYAYGTALEDQDRCALVLRTHDPHLALEVLDEG